MNTKWVIATALLFTVSWAIDTSAHSSKRGENKHSNSSSLAERLALNEEQQVDLQALKAGIMEQKTALYEEQQARFAAVLTTGQLAAYDKLKAEHRKHSRASLSEPLVLARKKRGIQGLRRSMSWRRALVLAAVAPTPPAAMS